MMEDEKGQDEKVLAVNVKDAHYSDIMEMKDMREHIYNEISEFFTSYKTLEKGKFAKVTGWRGTEETMELIRQSHENYKKSLNAGLHQ